MSRLGAAALLAMAALCGSAAQAGQTGSRIAPYTPARVADATRLTTDAARVTMRDFSECVVRRSRPEVERLLATQPGTSAESALVLRLASSDCLRGGELRFQPVLLRGGVYEVLYRAEFARPPADLGLRADINYMAEADAAGTPTARNRAALLDFADCVVRRDPAGAHALLASWPAAEAESRAVAAMQPALGACLPQGTTLSFSRPMLRGAVAETLYRLARAPLTPRPSAATPASGND